MNKSKLISALALCGAMSFGHTGATANTTVITFNGLAGTNMVNANTVVPGQRTSFKGGTTAIVGGFNFDADQRHSVQATGSRGNGTSGFAFNGTDYFEGLVGSGYFTSMSQANGGAFSLNSFDMAIRHDRQNQRSPDVTVITGTLFGGGSISRTLTLSDFNFNASTQIGNDFSTFTLSGFTNLSSVTFANDAGKFRRLAFDNISVTVSPVPEAETYAMMLAGLGLVGFMVRRRKTSALS